MAIAPPRCANRLPGRVDKQTGHASLTGKNLKTPFLLNASSKYFNTGATEIVAIGESGSPIPVQAAWGIAIRRRLLCL